MEDMQDAHLGQCWQRYRWLCNAHTSDNGQCAGCMLGPVEDVQDAYRFDTLGMVDDGVNEQVATLGDTSSTNAGDL